MTENNGHHCGYAAAKRATNKALLVELRDGLRADEEVWIPLSQIHDDSEVWGAGDEGELVVTSWFAEKEGL